MAWDACVVRSAGNRPAAARAGGAPHRSRDIRVRLRRLDFDRVLDVPRAVEAKLEHGAAAAVPGTRATVFCLFVVVKHRTARRCPSSVFVLTRPPLAARATTHARGNDPRGPPSLLARVRHATPPRAFHYKSPPMRTTTNDARPCAHDRSFGRGVRTSHRERTGAASVSIVLLRSAVKSLERLSPRAALLIRVRLQTVLSGRPVRDGGRATRLQTIIAASFWPL